MKTQKLYCSMNAYSSENHEICSYLINLQFCFFPYLYKTEISIEDIGHYEVMSMAN